MTGSSPTLAQLRRHRPSPAAEASGPLSVPERRLLAAIAETMLPGGAVFPPASRELVARVETFFGQLPRSVVAGLRGLLGAIDAGARLRFGKRFADLGPVQRLALLEAWRTGSVPRRWALRLLATPLKLGYFDNPELFRSVGCVYQFDTPAGDDRPRAVRERAHDAAELDDDLELECDVVVIGTGAGGAVVASELARAGHAVVMLEEGGYFDRRHFNGRAVPMQKLLYRNMGATFGLGNVVLPIPVGRSVGGTTTINAGTCYRVPERVLTHWRDDFGLTELGPGSLDGYYERVEQVLGVGPTPAQHLGGAARVIARGCDALGWRHAPLRRNAPACDGQGVCCFGCPTDAKRSTNVSYVPSALEAGAELMYGARVDQLLIENGRAAGAMARAANGRRVTVRGTAVVVACGALMTPVLLLDNGLSNSSGQVGRNLSVHPAAASFAVFDEDISGFNAVPQGYAIEEFHDQGLLFEGASSPLDMGMSTISFIGPRLMELAERYDRVASFGFMIEDKSRGRVRSVRGQPLITYSLEARDVALLQRGATLLADVFFAAGAREVYPMVHGFDRLRSPDDVDRLRQARCKARDFEPAAYHPLGTARMGRDPRKSVVGPDHQSHDVRGLYVVDGAAVPSSLAVNPQLTIMAMATRAAEGIGRALD